MVFARIPKGPQQRKVMSLNLKRRNQNIGILFANYGRTHSENVQSSGLIQQELSQFCQLIDI